MDSLRKLLLGSDIISDILSVAKKDEAVATCEDVMVRCWICDKRLDIMDEYIMDSSDGPTIKGHIMAERFILPSIGIDGYICYQCINKKPDLKANSQQSSQFIPVKRTDIEHLIAELTMIWRFFDETLSGKTLTDMISKRLQWLKQSHIRRGQSIWSFAPVNDARRFYQEFKFVIDSLSRMVEDGADTLESACSQGANIDAETARD